MTEPLVLGIDGGGTSTVALLASAATGEVLGRGEAGPSNIQGVGVDAALGALDEAIDSAFASINRPRGKLVAACLGLAGVDRQEGLDIIHGWAARVALAESVTVANDATLLLAAGTPEGWGLAIIAGTGSIAFVKTPTGELGRCGGWGYLMGDEGSAYRIAVQGLRAACRAFDGIGSTTTLTEHFVEAMELNGVPDLIPAVYRGAWNRAAIAGLAPLVLAASETGDRVSAGIVREEATELARTAAGAVRGNGLPLVGLPIALAGGVLTLNAAFRTLFLNALTGCGIVPGAVEIVTEPALGAVVLARRAAV
jgi:N-acetylglucosamine kinase-like BadF-type ATPase